jgi:glutathione S-transferase
LGKKNPAINLPYLSDGEKVIAESDAILIYIAYRSGKPELVGRNQDEQVSLATAMGVTRDLHSRYVSLVYGRYTHNTFELAKADFL